MRSNQSLSKGEVHFSFDETPRVAKKSGWRAFVFDKLEFVGVSVLVFVISYGVLNYQAIYANLEYKWKIWQGVENPLERVVDTQNNTFAQDAALLAFNKKEKSKTVIPPLNLEITPPDVRLVIPRIHKNIPVVGVRNENLIARDWNALEKDLQESLRSGVIHYPGTALPGEKGNVVLTGHSSYYAWDAGRFKDVFALLHEVELGDRVVLYFNQRKYIYEVFDSKVVYPSEVDVLGQTNDYRLTLITCTPIGTNLKRLVLTARLVE